jgi:uncharacterized UBP type Zn finger protein
MLRPHAENALTVSRSQAHSKHLPDVTKAFSFEIEERLECRDSHAVRYTSRTETVLSVNLPNGEKRLLESLRELQTPMVIDHFRSPVTNVRQSPLSVAFED